MQIPKIRPSMRRAWRDCPRKVFYTWVAEIAPRDTKRALVIGSAYHKGLETWRRTRDFRAAVTAAKAYLEPEIAKGICPPWADAQAAAYVFGYVHAFREGPFADHFVEAPIFDPDDGEGGSCDAVATIGGKLWLIEDKTTSSFVDYDLMASALRLNDQCATYIAGFRERGFPIEGVKYRQVKKTMTKQTQKETHEQYFTRLCEIYSDPTNYREFEIRYSDAELKLLGKQREKTNLDILSYLDVFDLDAWPTNCNNCIGPYGPCDFLPLCTKARDSERAYQPTGKGLDDGHYQKRIWNTAAAAAITGKGTDFTNPFGDSGK